MKVKLLYLLSLPDSTAAFFMLIASHLSTMKHLTTFCSALFSTKHRSCFVIKNLMSSIKRLFPTWVQCDQIWRNFATFEKLKSLGQYLGGFFIFGEILNLFWQTSYAIGHILIVENDQILKHNFAIWSHWTWRKPNQKKVLYTCFTLKRLTRIKNYDFRIDPFPDFCIS